MTIGGFYKKFIAQGCPSLEFIYAIFAIVKE